MPKTYTGSAERGEIPVESRQDAEDHGGGLAEPQQNLGGSRRNSDRTPAGLAPRTPGAPKDHKHQKYSPRLRNAKTHSAGPKTPKSVEDTFRGHQNTKTSQKTSKTTKTTKTTLKTTKTTKTTPKTTKTTKTTLKTTKTTKTTLKTTKTTKTTPKTTKTTKTFQQSPATCPTLPY